jgi:hypothetical protein
MRRIHLAVGILPIGAFLASGRFMRMHAPPMAVLEDGMRMLYRSRHIYLLGSGLVNLMLGLYLRARVVGWRKRMQMGGSVLILAAPLLLLMAFVNEPGQGLRADLWQSRFGLFALFGGAMLHAIAGIGRPAERPEAKAAGAGVG